MSLHLIATAGMSIGELRRSVGGLQVLLLPEESAYRARRAARDAERPEKAGQPDVYRDFAVAAVSYDWVLDSAGLSADETARLVVGEAEARGYSLVSVSGPPGTGKSSLALAAEAYLPGRVYDAELAWPDRSPVRHYVQAAGGRDQRGDAWREAARALLEWGAGELSEARRSVNDARVGHATVAEECIDMAGCAQLAAACLLYPRGRALSIKGGARRLALHALTADFRPDDVFAALRHALKRTRADGSSPSLRARLEALVPHFPAIEPKETT